MPAEACYLFSVRNVVYKKWVPQARNLTTSAILMHIKIVGAINLFLNMIHSKDASIPRSLLLAEYKGKILLILLHLLLVMSFLPFDRFFTWLKLVWFGRYFLRIFVRNLSYLIVVRFIYKVYSFDGISV